MKKTITIASANGLFLLTLVLMLVLGSIMQMFSLTLGLIGTELLLILLPAVLLLRARNVPLAEGLRLRGLPVRWVVLCVLLGISTWSFTIWIEAAMIQVTGMLPVAVSDTMLPRGVVQSALYFLALAVAAPVCEEVLFRGAIQGAYENHRGAKFAIVITGLMFAFFHFRVTGLPALLPVAFLLGYVVWKSQSLLGGVLVHFGMNASSAIYTLASLNIEEGVFSINSPWINAGGLLVAAAILVTIVRWMPRMQGSDDAAVTPASGTDAAAPAPARRTGWVALYWPLLVSALLYLVVAGLTLMPMLNPDLTAVDGVGFTAPDAGGEAIRPGETHYTLTNRAGDVVGEAVCTVSPTSGSIHLACRRDVRGYEANVGSSYYSEGDNVMEWTAVWDAQTLDLLDYSYQWTMKDAQPLRVELRDGTLYADLPDGEASAAIPDATLMDYEWPWRAGFLTADAGMVYRVSFGSPLRWNESLQKSAPGSDKALLRVFLLEKITVPAGTFETWKVEIGKEGTAWYSGSPARLVRYDDGMLDYALTE